MLGRLLLLLLFVGNLYCPGASAQTEELGEQLKILAEAELSFSLEATGFEMGEIDLYIENLSPAKAKARR